MWSFHPAATKLGFGECPLKAVNASVQDILFLTNIAKYDVRALCNGSLSEVFLKFVQLSKFVLSVSCVFIV